MARYGFSIYGQSLYGAPILSVFSADPVVATPVDYGEVLVTWHSPGGAWDELRVVRNYLGYPVSVDNGDLVFTTTPAAAGSQVHEQDLRQDHWVYYTVFAHVTADDEWVRSGLARCFVPSDYGGTERLLSLTPEVGKSDTLTKFMGVFGYAYDLLRNDINSLLDLYDSMAVSYDLVPLVLAQFGIPIEPELEPEQYRRFLRNAAFLYKVKGTEPGIHGVVASITGWPCDVTIGRNLLWTSDYSDFLGSVAGWQALVNSSVAWAAPTGPDSGSLQMTATATAAASSAVVTERLPLTAVEINQSVNLLTPNQASLETDTTGWINAWNATIARSTAQALDGSASLSMTSVAAGDMWAATTTGGTSGIPITGGKVYTFVASFRAATGSRSCVVEMDFFDASGTIISNPQGQPIADIPTGWRQATVTKQAPSNAAFVQCYTGVFATGGAGEVHYVDAVGLFPDPLGNLITNPDFENGTTGWTAYGTATAVQSTAQAYVGRASAQVTIPAGPNGFYSGATFKVQAGTTYTQSAWVFMPTGGTCTLGNDQTGNSAAVTCPAGAWTRVTQTWTATATATIGVMYVGPSVASAIYVDAVKVEKGATATPFVPRSYSNLYTAPQAPEIRWYGAGGAGTQTDLATGGPVGSGAFRRKTWTAGAASDDTGYQMTGLNADLTVTASMWMRSNRPQVISAFPYYTDGSNDGGGYASDHVVATLQPNVWTRVSRTFTPPAGKAIGTIVFSPMGNGAVAWQIGDTLDAADAQVVYGTVPLPYIDGAQGPGYSWDASENLITNPSFETDASGWTGIGENLLIEADFETGSVGDVWSSTANCTRANSTVQALSGTRSMALTATAAGDMNVTSDTNRPGNGQIAAPGRLYTAIAHVRAGAAPRQVFLTLRFVNAAGDAVTSSVNSVHFSDNASGWTQARVVAIADANAATVDLSVNVLGCAAGEVHYVDNVGIYPTPLIAGGGVNMVDNGDFENDTTGWSAPHSGVLALSTTRAYTGRQSLQVTTAASTAGEQGAVGPTIPTVAGVTYTLSARVYNPSSGGLPGGVILAAAGVAYGPSTTTKDAWVNLTYTFTGTGASFSPEVVNVGGDTFAAGRVFYLDAVKVEVGSAATPFVPRSYSNLITNPSFEVDTTGWIGLANGTMTRSTAQAFSGTTSLLFTRSNSTIGNAGVAGTLAGLVVGQVYTVSVYLKAIQNTYWRMQVGGISSTSAIGSTGAWIRKVITFTATASSHTLYIEDDLSPAPASGDALYIDAVQLELGNIANPYADGSLGSGYSWDASENLLSAAASSFEDGTTGTWTTVGGSVANSAVRAFNGTKSLAVTLATAAGALGTGAFVNVAGCAPNTTYTVSMYSYNATGGVASVQMRIDNGGAGIYSTSAAVTTKDAWVRTVLTGTTDGTGVLHIFVGNGAAATAGQVVYIDAIQVEQRSYATPYGATGTANATRSTVKIPWGLTGQQPIAQYGGGGAVSGAGLLHNNLEVNPNLYGSGVSTVVMLAPNTTYTFSAYSQRTAGLGATYYLMADGPGLSAPAVSSGGTADGGWNRRVLTFTTNASGGKVYLRVLGNLVPVQINVDAVQLEQRDHATPYGSTGVANASTSTKQAGARAVVFSLAALVRALDLSTATASVRFDWYGANGALLGSTDGPATTVRRGVDSVVALPSVSPPYNTVEFAPVLVIHSPTGGQRWQWRRVMVNRSAPVPYEPGRDIRISLTITDTDAFRRAVHLDRLGKILPRYLPLGATFTLLDAAAV